jgi:hypothetical protein
MEWIYTTVQFEPWRGTKYETGITGHRILVLGESHYHSCNGEEGCSDEISRDGHHRNLTFDVVNWWIDNPHRSPLSYRVPELFQMTKAEFWDSVAFYNYLQTFAGPVARHRPKEEQWADDNSAKAFQSVLDSIQPDRILVLGKDTWTNLPSSQTTLFCAPIPENRLQLQNNVGSRNAADEIAYWYGASSGNMALAMPIVHPSAFGFSSADWIPSIDLWLRLSPPSLFLPNASQR